MGQSSGVPVQGTMETSVRGSSAGHLERINERWSIFFIIGNVRHRWLSFSDRSVHFFMSEDARNSLPG